METIGSPGLWAGFVAFVVLALLVDFRLMTAGGPHAVSPREALRWSAAWIGLALLFNTGLWWYLRGIVPHEDARRIAFEFLTGYLVEKSLAVDNIFVFLMLFTYFKVPAPSQQRVLAWGVLGAIGLRAILIFIGAALLARFHWLLYVFGAFLLLTGVKMLWAAGQQPDLDRNPLLRWLTAHLPLTSGYHGERLWLSAADLPPGAAQLRDGGVAGARAGANAHASGAARYYTPLFVVLVMIGITDVIFAVDSIPAIFAITTDPFIVLSSNVFAVLGLRALYFLLADMAGRFHLLSVGLAGVLVFIGAKMLLVDWVKIPVLLALAVVGCLIGGAIALSLLRPAAAPPGPPAPGQETPQQPGDGA